MQPALSIPLALTLVATPAAAQLVSGLAFERGDALADVGVQLGGRFDRNLTERFGLRFDVTFLAWRPGEVRHYGPCPPPAAGPGPCGLVTTTRSSLTMASTTLNVRYLEQREGGAAFYWIAGVGLYGVTGSPGDGSYARPGWNVGGGFRLGRSLSLDVRYHHLIDPRTTRAVVPVSLGVRL